ncbi:unnamed protein product [Strongylus vulgaris]|uniref:Uncharacterized protein n=1 Tax=Strongylus vulgaris TaxID=40348 RepID=A0A3P7IQG6_STRVU|nr:unnamed protein product [Strongylus vulgaris]
MLTPTFHYNILQEYHEIFAQQGEVTYHSREYVDQFAIAIMLDLSRSLLPKTIDFNSETAMGTSINAQIGGNNEYVRAVQRLSTLIWDYQRFS